MLSSMYVAVCAVALVCVGCFLDVEVCLFGHSFVCLFVCLFVCIYNSNMLCFAKNRKNDSCIPYACLRALYSAFWVQMLSLFFSW